MNNFYIPVRWRFFSVIFILSFLSYMLRQHFPVAGEFMMRELAISELQMGWVYGAFFGVTWSSRFPEEFSVSAMGLD